MVESGERTLINLSSTAFAAFVTLAYLLSFTVVGLIVALAR